MRTSFATEHLDRICSLMFSTAAEGLVVVDRSGTIRLMNPRMHDLFGYEDEELLGSSIELLLPGAMRERHVEHRTAYMQAPKQRPMGSELKLLGQRKDGSSFPIEVSLNHFVMDGEAYAMALVTDVTLRKRAEAELQQANAELEERVSHRTAALLKAESDLKEALDKERELNALKSRFVATASHEFRTPLSTILSSVDLIARYTEGHEKVDKHVERIRTKVRELTAMLNEFLSLEKLEQGMVLCKPEAFDVVDLCVELIEELRHLAKPGQEVRYDHVGEERMLFQDRQMLRNVMSNLLGNAIKYSPPQKKVELRTSLEGGMLTVHVADEGIGIPLEDQPHLFERFFRASNAFTVQGTGLGLNIVRRYLDIMGGSIGFSSKPGAGTSFTATLPQRHQP